MVWSTEKAPKLGVVVTLVIFAVGAIAQEAAKRAEVSAICPSVMATVMVSKVNCSATLCNTGASQGGWLGLATQMATRGSAIDSASFTLGFGAQLATAFKQTGCFSVVDAASIEESKREMEALGRPAPPMPTVDFVIRSDVAKAELVIDETGFLAYKSTTAKSTLGLDVKLVSASSGAITEAGTYESLNEKKSSGVDLIVYRSGDDAAKRVTPFADVSRDVIVKAVMGLTPKIVSQIGQSRSAAAAPNPPAAPVPAGPASVPQ